MRCFCLTNFLVLLTLSWIAAAPVGAQPVILNPSFEDGPLFQPPDNWTMWVGPGGNTAAPVHEILYSGQIHGTFALAVSGILDPDGKGDYQYIPNGWISGHTYVLSVYVKNLDPAQPNLDYAIGYLIGSGTAAQAPSATFGTPVASPANWTQATVQFTYSGSAGVTVYLRARNTGDDERAGFDLVQVTDLDAPTPTPTLTPTPGVAPTPDRVTVLRQGNLGGGAQVYFAAADVTRSRDERVGAPGLSIIDPGRGAELSPWAPGSLDDKSPGFLDGVQCVGGTSGEVRDAVGACTSNRILSPFGANLVLTKPDDPANTNVPFNLPNYVGQISNADPRVPFDENSPDYPVWVTYRVKTPYLVGAQKVYVWFRNFKPPVQIDGDCQACDDSYWIVASPEPSVTDRSVFYIADDADGPGDNDGPDLSGNSPQLFNYGGDIGKGQWMWGSGILDTNSNLGDFWCTLPAKKVSTAGNLVVVIYTTVPDDGEGNAIVQFYLVGREAEYLEEAQRIDLICLSTVGFPDFVPSDNTFENAQWVNEGANVERWEVFR